MKTKKCRVLLFASTLLTLGLALPATGAITFETVQLGSPNGPAGVWNGQAGSGNQTVEGVGFNNSYTDYGGGYYGWDGFSYSNHTDTTTAGNGNQYSSYAGGGAGGSSQYAVGYGSSAITFNLADTAGKGAYITNTTYAALSMLNGDAFAKKFGGVSGNEADYLKLTISGFAGGIPTANKVDFYLADFRFADNSQDYIVDDWTYVDFSPLGLVDEIRFSYESSDVGGFGINTPTYFAIDNLSAIPEPSSILLGLSGICLVWRRNRRNA